MSITDATGGRTVASTNTPEVAVPGIFEANSLYYLWGPDPGTARRTTASDERTGEGHRPGAIVQTRTGYFPTPEGSKPRTNAARTPLDAALAADLPVRDIPLRLSAAVFWRPRPSGSRGRHHLGGSAPRCRAGPGDRDRDGRFRHGLQDPRCLSPDARVLTRCGPTVETFSRLPLKPGRYEIRLAAEAGGKSGGAKTFIEVPDFAKEPLSLSGLVIERRPPGAVANRPLIADLLPIVPTTVREFSRSDRAIAFVRMYQRTGGPAEPVKLSWRILGDDNRTAVADTATLPADVFSPNHSADGRFMIPLAELRAGEHLLTVEAVRGDRRIRRDVRFTSTGSVRPAVSSAPRVRASGDARATAR